MTDINTPHEGEHSQEPAEGGGIGGAPEEREHSQEPAEGGDEKSPPAEMSSWNIEPPPTDGAEIPGVPDQSSAIEGGTEGEPGSNATGVGS